MLLKFAGLCILARNGKRHAQEIHAERAGVKARIHEKTCEQMGCDRYAVDGGDQHAAALTCLQALLPTSKEKVRETCGDVRAVRLIIGQKDEQVGIVTTQPRYELTVTKNDLSVRCTGEDARSRFG